MQSIHTWDQYFMSIAYMVSMKSKDLSTRVGAIIVGENNDIRATGFNGFPRGVKDTDARYQNREHKYLFITHAEENAILNCARIGTPIEGCKIYVPWIPCCRCTTSIIQAGIKEVIYDNQFPGNHPEKQGRWKESISLTIDMMKEAGIVLRSFDGEMIKFEGLYNGEIFQK